MRGQNPPSLAVLNLSRLNFAHRLSFFAPCSAMFGKKCEFDLLIDSDCEKIEGIKVSHEVFRVRPFNYL